MFVGWSRPFKGGSLGELAARIRELSADSAESPLRLHNRDEHLVAGQPCLAYSVDSAVSERWIALVAGHPTWSDPECERLVRQYGLASSVGKVYERLGRGLVDKLHGVFAISIYDREKRTWCLATDRFGTIPIYYTTLPDGDVGWGSSVSILRANPLLDVTVDPQAIFHYLYFHMVPSPDSIYKGVYKLRPNEVVIIGEGGSDRHRYWFPRYSESTMELDLEDNVRQSLKESVAQFAKDRPGTFLSGGLDSSTVTGLLAKEREGDVDAYSIGFSAEGYDEIEYARIAAKHFGVRHHEYYLTPEDVVDAIPKIASAYDEPFGNSSAVPTYVCSRFARANGTSVLLAGDGGDELFAGNERYLKQQFFEYYDRVPSGLRRVLETAQGRRICCGWVPYLGKFYSYIAQAKIPLPDRLQTYNFMERQPLSDILAGRMLEGVDPEVSKRLQREEFDLDANATKLNRMLRLDWRFTLADNDLRKVGAMTRVAGVQVHYPMLMDAVADAAARIPSKMKMAHHNLRHFYKEAFKDFLPRAILSKSKHGFGLPFGVWMKEHPGLHDLAYDAIVNLKKRDLLSGGYLDKLLDQHRHEHAVYYGEMVWVLMMLEHWFQAQAGVRSTEIL